MTNLKERIVVESKIENVEQVSAFVLSRLQENDVSMKIETQFAIAIDELFSNIAFYAYKGGVGDIAIETYLDGDMFSVSFIDSGVAFNPLKKQDPNVSLGIEEREAGGLGIFIVKQSMDDVRYEYINNQNVLTISKKIK